MPDIKIYLDAREMAFVKQQPKGYVRSLVRQFMEKRDALSAGELKFLAEHGGVRGVIRLAGGRS